MSAARVDSIDRMTRVRYVIVAMLFVASCFSYGDRAALSVAGVAMQKSLAISPLRFGWLLSGFGWAYVLGQLPSGGLLDRYGSKAVYGVSIICWSVCAFLVALAGYLPLAWVFTAIFVIRLLSGLAQSPVFPGNGRIVAAWFPAAERGRASSIFNASQYFALVAFAPLFGWLTFHHGWQSCFWFIGGFGLLLAFAWKKLVYDVKEHPRISEAEISHIELGGGLVNTGRSPASGFTGGLTWSIVRQLLSQRMLVGIYLGQFCINTLTTFFLTWFPSYLAEARHLSIVKVGVLAALPALCGSGGGVLGGIVSDSLLKRGRSLSFARKAPIILGMLLSMTMIGCNYTNSQVVVMVLMSLAFFGKGFGALGWTVIADVSPRTMIGMNGGVFNFFGNLSSISTPIIIGLIKSSTGSYNGALVFVGITALMAIFSYVVIVGEIRRVDLVPVSGSR
ncbi:MFS transporter, ACS family, glucarate transporter [Bryocella elongata]|uniref:MFS transporter, ACS family, glucarate transporter n=1 Tax=Bryocella elongata TaxID=863522 RepID=A0A1H5ZJG5_9BACT|nr:MFS transporter [Bryocella elongata]SEG36648.1 MFS transporter, ACS family, glucarate transporter [Bryocella elongata]